MPTTVPDRSTARYDHEQLLATLNERQREAVTAPDGPILVIAGPGSGKTRVICARIAHLVRTGRSEPARIAALTFTRKAANDMAQRLRTMLPSCSVRTVASFVVGDPDQAIYGPRPQYCSLNDFDDHLGIHRLGRGMPRP